MVNDLLVLNLAEKLRAVAAADHGAYHRGCCAARGPTNSQEKN
jgi:hypothetical protein